MFFLKSMLFIIYSNKYVYINIYVWTHKTTTTTSTDKILCQYYFFNNIVIISLFWKKQQKLSHFLNSFLLHFRCYPSRSYKKSCILFYFTLRFEGTRDKQEVTWPRNNNNQQKCVGSFFIFYCWNFSFFRYHQQK